MKILHIETRKILGPIKFSVLAKLPGKTISLASTIQYLDFVPKIKSYLESKGKKVMIKKGAKYPAHILGCQSHAFNPKADTLLLLADGKFHAINNAVQLQKPIYIFNLQKLEKITKQEINKINLKTQAKQKKFLLYNNIGVITSTKPGQSCNPKNLIKQLKKLGKHPYIFQTETLNPVELENFPIQLWLNTACPGIGLEQDNIINIQDIQEFL